MKKFIFIVLLGLYSMLAYSQEPCGQNAYTQYLLNQYPQLQQSMQDFEDDYVNFLANGAERSVLKYTIPVVVHVMHKDATDKFYVTDDDVKDAIKELNENFQNLQGSWGFGKSGLDAQIEFKLAKIDPKCKPTTGIERIATPEPYGSPTNYLKYDTKLKEKTSWNNYNYYNIWVVKDNFVAAGQNNAFSYANVVGSITNPASLSSDDGTVIVYQFLNKKLTSASSTIANAYTLTHETGHYLGLYHIWGADNNSSGTGKCNETNCETEGDRVCGTPAQTGSGDCKNLTLDSCPNDVSMDIPWNYMGYNIDCLESFQEGQITRMHACLEKSRFNLWSPDNLNVTGLTSLLPDYVNLVVDKNTTWTTANYAPNKSHIDVWGDIQVQPNITFTIEQGVKVKINRDVCEGKGKIIVKNDAKLALNGATITNTDSRGYWNGIDVWGDNSLSQIYGKGFGQMTTSQGTKIENAKSVRLYDENNPATKAGGRIKCSRTSFLNNYTAVDFMPYKNFAPSSPKYAPSYAGSFFDCSFIVDDKMPGYPKVSQKFFTHANLAGVKGINFSGCTFRNDLTNWNKPASGGEACFQTESGFAPNHAIYANNSTFHVYDYCGSTSPTTYQAMANCIGKHSSFNGFSYGIKASSNQYNSIFNISNATFENNEYGIYLNAMNFASVQGNEFTFGQLPSGNPASDQIGLMIDGSSLWYGVQKNNFRSNGSSSAKTIGIIAKDTGGDDKKINQNTFTGIDYANVANGNNEFFTSNPSIQTGLLYECNQNKDNKEHDFAWIKEQNSLFNPFGLVASLTNACTVKRSHGASNGIGGYFSAANTFTKSFSTTQQLIHVYDFNLLSSPHTYLYNDANALVEKPIQTLVKTSNKGTANNCNPLIPPFGLQGGNDYDALLGNYQSLATEYRERLDAGNENLKEEVAKSDKGSADEISKKLLSYSPWLSLETLASVVENADNFGVENTRQILLANPNVFNYDFIADYLTKKQNPWSEEEVKSLEAMDKSESNERSELSTKLAVLYSQMQNIAYANVFQALEEDNEKTDDKVEEWLQKVNSYQADMILAKLYQKQERIGEVSDLMNNAIQKHGLLGEKADNHALYAKAIEAQNAITEGGDFQSNAAWERLLELSYSSEGDARLLSRNLLKEKGYCFDIEYLLPEGTKSKGRSLKSSSNQKRINALKDLVKVYPTNTADYINVEWKLPSKTYHANFAIIDMNGRAIYNEKLQGNDGFKQINVSLYPDGLYFYQIMIDGTYQQSGKFVVGKF